MEPYISVIIPAYNEQYYIAETLRSLRQACKYIEHESEIVVVDDGSRDETFGLACTLADAVIQHTHSMGKGAAMLTGCKTARGRILVFLDADLGETAQSFPSLVEPLYREEADMVIARLPAAAKKSGFGLVRTLAGHGVYRLSGFTSSAPLSGQRAIRREVIERIGRMADGFGVEVGLTIDAVKLGYRVQEQFVPFAHRVSGRDLGGWLHRGKQFCAVGSTLWNRWREPIC
ncbi:glycosyltransferase family 2 protein [Paenibacillus sp. H1-7]|uniref:glycosyltransferase family 2 protein n=1 Tax=Paenibacillus sp. H1-7 TaxID=2282849 RepID=UPI001EF78266|nr:glycosyltransferase family 2 protein [Paenibacillus sp. H1-7]ULL15472.1 glycosyltransferase family 2 protein [Paenibacillus sp. H1-7]